MARHYEDASTCYPGSDVRLVGLCTGSLAAAAVASSHSLSHLLPLAVETVGIAFRVGLHARKAASLLGGDVEEQEPWAHVFTNDDQVSVKPVLDDFNRDSEIPKPSRPYVSALGPKSTTISGPPSTLRQLIEKSQCLQGPRSTLPLHAPYHAPHLYTLVDLKAVALGRRPETEEVLHNHQPRLPIYSTSTGELHTANNTTDLFTHALHDILQECLRWDQVLRSYISDVPSTEPEERLVLAFGPTKATSGLITALQANSNDKVKLQDSQSWLLSVSDDSGSAQRVAKPKLAIVGMAGRFPGGADHEAFWESLEQGLDLHKEVCWSISYCQQC